MQDISSDPYLKCPQRRLYSAWKIADIYLCRFAEYWNAMSASLRKLEIFSVRTSAVFPYACLKMSAERSTDVCGHLCRRLCGQTSTWMGADVCADVPMDGCGHLRTSTWIGANVRGSQHGWVWTSAGPKDLLELLPLLCNNLLIICGFT